MSSGGCIEGNCVRCGSYTKNVSFKWHGLCLACWYEYQEKLKQLGPGREYTIRDFLTQYK